MHDRDGDILWSPVGAQARVERATLDSNGNWEAYGCDATLGGDPTATVLLWSSRTADCGVYRLEVSEAGDIELCR